MGMHGPCDRPGSTTVLALVLSLGSGTVGFSQMAGRPVDPGAVYPPAPTTSYSDPRDRDESVLTLPSIGPRPTPLLRRTVVGWLKRHAAPVGRKPAPSPRSADDNVVRATRGDEIPASVAATNLAPPAELPVEAAAAPSVSRKVKAAAKVEGTPAPGLRITLSGRESIGEALRYLWVQTKGPEVRLERSDSPTISFLVPGGATELAFQLIVAGPHGVDRVAVNVPLQLLPKPILPAVVQADAGDDQVAVVGRRVTLNAVRSQPRDRVAFRWIQAEGSAVKDQSEESWICSFVPTGTGLHRFMLVVSADGVISKPDEVLVSVLSESDAPSDLRAAASRGVGETRGASPAEALARRLLTSVEPGGQHGRDLAGAFESVADRLALYHSYADLHSEIARRLGAIVPSEPIEREAWDEALFLPLSGQIVSAMKALNLDPADQPDRALNPEHKKRLDDLFRDFARGFRAVAPPSADETPAP